ncbi:MAG: hypothetical protein RR437_08745 [Clostridium sp.]
MELNFYNTFEDIIQAVKFVDQYTFWGKYIRVHVKKLLLISYSAFIFLSFIISDTKNTILNIVLCLFMYPICVRCIDNFYKKIATNIIEANPDVLHEKKLILENNLITILTNDQSIILENVNKLNFKEDNNRIYLSNSKGQGVVIQKIFFKNDECLNLFKHLISN